MRRTLQSALLLGLSSLGAAVFKDEVDHIDFHHALVGVPQVETTFFHRPRKEDKASLLYTLSDVGVIGAMNPSNGAIVWRQQVADEVTNGGGFLRAPEGENWVAAAHGHKVQAWDALTGRSFWQMDFTGEVKDLEIMEMTENSRKDVLVLFDEGGVTVLRRLHGTLGTVVWEFREVGRDVPLQVSTNIAHIYVISLHGSPSSYNLRVTSLDNVTGTRVSDTSVGNKGDIHGPEDVKFVGANSAAPLIAWRNQALNKLSVHVLGTKGKQDFGLASDVVSVDIHAPHLAQSQPHFLVHTRTQDGNRAEVYHINLKSGQITSAYELPQLRGMGAFSTSSDGANVYFTRVLEDEIIILSSESSAPLARWRYKPEPGSEAVHGVSEVIKKPGGEGFAVRSAAVTTTEDWIMIRNGEQDWSRPEGLSGAVGAVYAEIPEVEGLAKALEQESHTNPVSAYVHRVTRHIDDLRYLPDYLASIPTRFVDSIFGSDISSRGSGLQRDTFGFNKIIVVATRRGRFYGLDTGNHGEVVWSKSVFPQVSGQALDVKGIMSKDDEGVVIVRGSKGEYVSIKAVTGDIVDVQSAGSPVSSTAIIDGESGQWLLSLGPDGKPSDALPAGAAPQQTIVFREEGDIIKAFKFVQDGDKVMQQEVWQLQNFPGQKIADIATLPAVNPVASIGRVLGDRTVNYKYLNPNSIVVAVVDEAVSSLSVRLVDSVSGEVLASQSFDGVDSSKPVSCTMAENWYTCSFFGESTLNDGTDRLIKGYQIVVADLYESSSANDRGPLGDAANFSSLNPIETPSGVSLPWVVSQSWIVSQPLTSLSVTQTRQGIANRQVLAYLPESHGILSMPRYILDPRRPVGRDPTPAEMEAEALMKYAPGIEIDARTIVSHERDVVGVQGILATPAVVESTSLVVAYGVDVFGTRVAPSGSFDQLGKGFDKLTLMGTVLALFGGVMFLGPMVRLPVTQVMTFVANARLQVRRKQINRRWEG